MKGRTDGLVGKKAVPHVRIIPLPGLLPQLFCPVSGEDDMMIMKLTSTIREILTISSLSSELSPTRTPKRPGRNDVPLTCSTPAAHDVQHVVC